MKAWIVRFVSLYAFNVVVLLFIGLVLGNVRVGLAAFWASLILTAATIWLKPLIRSLFGRLAARSADRRSRVAEKVVQGLLVFAVELVVWVAVVSLSPVGVRGWFWGWVIPPIALLIAFAVYDLVDDRIEARTEQLYDRVSRPRTRGGDLNSRREAPPAPRRDEPRPDRHDGLTDEQRRMFDELG